MNVVTVSLGQLVDGALAEVQAPHEIGRALVRSAALNASETTFTLSDPLNVNPADVLEFASELMLVVGKTSDPSPVFTVSRGYAQTTATTHPGTQTGTVNPQFNRKRVAAAIVQSFPCMEANGLVLIRNTTVVAVADSTNRIYLPMPSETRDVWSVRKGLVDASRWEFIDNLPSVAPYTTGRVVRMARNVTVGDSFFVQYRTPYRWSTFPAAPDEAATIDVLEGAESVPIAYALAWLVSKREISRSEIDRSQEWQAGEPLRGGVSTGQVRALWQEFYRKLDEARRLDPPSPRRPYLRRA